MDNLNVMIICCASVLIVAGLCVAWYEDRANQRRTEIEKLRIVHGIETPDNEDEEEDQKVWQ